MNLSKRILLACSGFMSIGLCASELTPALQKHLHPPFASIVEEYVYDGTMTLNPRYPIQMLQWCDFGLASNQFYQLHAIFDHQYKAQAARTLETLKLDRDSTHIVLNYINIGYFDEKVREQSAFAGVTHTICENHIPKDALVPVIPQMLLKAKNPGDRVMVTDTNGKQYDFKLAEDRKANVEEVTQWAKIGERLIERGFIGTHAQTIRFLANRDYFFINRGEISKLERQDPALLTDSEKERLNCWDFNIDYVVHGKKERK